MKLNSSTAMGEAGQNYSLTNQHSLINQHFVYILFINAQSVSLHSLVAAESTLQQPMQPARDHPLFVRVLNVLGEPSQ